MAHYHDRTRNPVWMVLFEFTTINHTPALGLGVVFALLSSLIMPTFSIILGDMFNLFTLFGSRQIPDDSLIQKASNSCIKLAILGLVGWVLNGVYFILFVTFGELQAVNAHNIIFESLLKKNQQYFQKQQDGTRTFLSCLQTHIYELQMASSQPLGFVLQHSFRAFASLGLSLYTSWKLSLVILAAFPIFLVTTPFFSSKINENIAAQNNELSQASKVVNCAVTYIETVKCHNAQSFELQNFFLGIDKAASRYLRQAHFSSLQISIMRFVMFEMFAQGFWYGSTLALSGQLSSGEVLRTFWACLTAAQAVEALLPQLRILEKGKFAAASLRDIMKELPSEISAKEMQGTLYPEHCEGDIKVSNVSFRYPADPSRLALRSSSFFFPAGTTTFVIGKSGSGKSTLGQLLSRFYLPSSGEILIDGIPLHALSVTWIRNNITLVEQKAVLFKDSILKNVAFGRRDYEDIRKSDMKEAISAGMLKDTIENLPKGIETCVGDGGTFLSGGQRQRIAIARARMRDTPILILDEPTSALDGANCNNMMSAIRNWRNGKTTVIITHDMSHIKSDDFIYVLDQGFVIQCGYKRELEGHPFMNRKLIQVEANHDWSGDSSDSECENISDSISCGASSFNPLLDSDHQSEFSKPNYLQQPKASFIKKSNISLPKNSMRSYSRQGSEWSSQADISRHSILNSHDIGMNELSYARGRDQPQETISNPERINFHTLAFVKVPLRRTMQTLVPSLISSERLLLFVGCICAVGHAGSTPLFSYFLSQLLESFYREDSRSAKWAIAILGVAACDACISYFMHYLLEFCGQKWVDSLRKRAFRRILDQDRKWFEEEKNSPTQISTCLYESGEEMKNLVGRFGGFILIAVSVTLVAVVWSLTICWELTFVTLSCCPIIFAILRAFETTSSVWDRRCNDARMCLSNIFVETFSELRTVQSLTLEPYFHQKYLKSVSRCMKVGLKRAVYLGPLFGLVECTIIFLSALIFFYGTALVSYREYTVADMMTVFSILLFSIGYASSVVACIPQISTCRESATQLLRLVNLPEGISHEHLGHLIPSKSTPVEINRLNFQYPSRVGASVLKDLSVRFPEGSCTAIVGPSGSGKSTIASLLLSLYETPHSLGENPTLSFGGDDIQVLNIPALRSLISIVSQESSVLPMTVYANIIYGLDKRSPLCRLHNVRAAAKAAAIDDFISSLPKGYFTPIGDGGVGISGGQAQRLMIARALVRQPQILVLDEATSSLDPYSAEKIGNAVQKLVSAQTRLTVIIITHSKKLMKIADNIIFLEEGRVVEQGRYKELAKRPGGKLRSLIKRQDTNRPQEQKT